MRCAPAAVLHLCSPSPQAASYDVAEDSARPIKLTRPHRPVLAYADSLNLALADEPPNVVGADASELRSLPNRDRPPR
jgi:hypothetical protein